MKNATDLLVNTVFRTDRLEGTLALYESAQWARFFRILNRPFETSCLVNTAWRTAFSFLLCLLTVLRTTIARRCLVVFVFSQSLKYRALVQYNCIDVVSPATGRCCNSVSLDLLPDGLFRLCRLLQNNVNLLDYTLVLLEAF